MAEPPQPSQVSLVWHLGEGGVWSHRLCALATLVCVWRRGEGGQALVECRQPVPGPMDPAFW